MAKTFATTIGKDVIESLTTSMYEDSRFIFREYIQNSADQIDKAERENILKPGEGEIHIIIEEDNKFICIEDNATGISEGTVTPILKNIAQSTKQRGIDKGFRGIGRLGGLAYCEQLIFETSAKGEKVKSVMTWDAALLRSIINNRLEKEEAAKVIDEVTTFKTEPEKADEHYFRVKLVGVNNQDLLNLPEVRKYLSMVAPVPFYPTTFLYKGKIGEELRREGISLDEYAIYINTERLFKGYSTHIYEGNNESKKILGEIIDVIFFEERNEKDELLYWGWYGISEKNQSLSAVNQARGFRLRKSNIQIGDEYSLVKLHRDRRFQFYFIGEIHALHPNLIPNARRDYFSENETYKEFEKRLVLFFHTTIYKLCYTAADINSSVKKIEQFNSFQKEYKEKTQKEFTDRAEQQEYIEKLDKKREEAEKAENKLERIVSTSQNGATTPIDKIIERVATDKSAKIKYMRLPDEDMKPKLRTDNLTSLSKDKRKLIGEVFRIIKNVLPNEMAESLITKIEEEMR